MTEGVGPAAAPAVGLDLSRLTLEDIERHRESLEQLGDLTLTEAAQLADVSTVTVKKWIDEDPEFPLGQRGRNGRHYEIPAIEFVAWFVRREQSLAESEAARRERVQQMRLELFGDPVAELTDKGMSARDVQAEIEAQRRAMQLAAERGDLVRAAKMREALEDAFGEFRNQAMQLADRLGRELDLDHAGRTRTRELCRQMLTSLAHNLGASGALELSEAAE